MIYRILVRLYFYYYRDIKYRNCVLLTDWAYYKMAFKKVHRVSVYGDQY